jgi:hypothetical protein
MGARIRGVMTHAFFEAMLSEWTLQRGQRLTTSWFWTDRTGCAESIARHWKDDLAVSIALSRCTNDLDPGDAEGLDELRDCLPGCAKAAHDATILALRDADEVLSVEDCRALKLPGSHRWVFGVADAVIRQGKQLVLIELKTTSAKQLDTIAERYRTNPAVDLYAAMIEHGRNARKG